VRKASWRPPPWFDRPGRRISFIHELRALDSLHLGHDSGHKSGLVVSFTLRPSGVPTRRVTIQFLPLSPDTPHVYVDGPPESPHRYGDGSLCMWYPMDPPERKWNPNAGAADLVMRIAVHLIKEEWYRRHGEWIGEEVGHHQRNQANDPDTP
jgi:hypothetical protein